MSASIVEIGGTAIAPGERRSLQLPVAELYNSAPVHMPVEVVRGRRDGPTLFVCAAVHGDEINGVEIIRRLLRNSALQRMRGTLIAVPIVNVQGFLSMSRYLPDRRDLNRSFPGSERGSVAGRLAWMFAQEIVAKSDCGIDLHTGAIHRSNLPQVRANLSDPETAALAAAFAAPVMLDANLRDGSLREHAAQQGIPMLLYEAGEALRFDETAIRAGVRGVLNVMRCLGMLARGRAKAAAEPLVATSSYWQRAEQSGILRCHVGLGARVKKGQLLATISDPFGHEELALSSRSAGLVIGRSNLPLVNEGDALFHIARFESVVEAENALSAFQEQHESDLPVDVLAPEH